MFSNKGHLRDWKQPSESENNVFIGWLSGEYFAAAIPMLIQ